VTGPDRREAEPSTPPEVLFDRFFQQFKSRQPVRPEDPDPRPYRGKRDLSGLSPLVETLLTSIQRSFNEALRNEKQNVPEHKPHPPFHFDYIDSEVPNALAFSYANFSFIGITMGLVDVLWETCVRLSRSETVGSVLGIPISPERYEPIHVALFRIQLSFVISHEFTHHVHGHVSGSMFFDEVRGGAETGNLEKQVLEVDADGYAAYHVLAHLMESEGRPLALELLDLEVKPRDIQDQVLFSCFVAAIAAYMFVRPPDKLDGTAIYKLTHPPQAARMNCLMQQAIAWCKQNLPALAEWMTLSRFQNIMEVVAEATWGMNGGRSWESQTSFLQSEEGAEYFGRLDQALKAHVQSL
jgi:hypothetical protein